MWCKPRGEVENELPQIALHLSAEKGLAQAHLCVGAHVCLQEEREGVYRPEAVIVQVLHRVS